ALRVVDPMIEKARDALPGALRFHDRAPLEVRLPAGAEQAPVAGGDRLAERLDPDAAEMPFKDFHCRACEREAAARGILRQVAGDYFRSARVVARDADRAQDLSASSWLHTLRKAATTRSMSSRSRSCRHIWNPRKLRSCSSSATGQIPVR